MLHVDLCDGEILEVNQVVSSVAYVHHIVLGLHLTTLGNVLGFLPGDSDNPAKLAVRLSD